MGCSGLGSAPQTIMIHAGRPDDRGIVLVVIAGDGLEGVVEGEQYLPGAVVAGHPQDPEMVAKSTVARDRGISGLQNEGEWNESAHFDRLAIVGPGLPAPVLHCFNCCLVEPFEAAAF